MRTESNEATLALALAYSQTDSATALGLCKGTTRRAVPVPFFVSGDPDDGIETFCPKINEKTLHCDDGGTCIWERKKDSQETQGPIKKLRTEHGDLILDTDARTVISPLRPETTVDLAEHPAIYAALDELMLQQGGVASYENIYYGYPDRVTRGTRSELPHRASINPIHNTVQSDISKLRKFLGETKEDRRKIIISIPKVGYRINTPKRTLSKVPVR